MSKRKLRVLLGTSLLCFGPGLFGASNVPFRTMDPSVVACDLRSASPIFGKGDSQGWSRIDGDSSDQSRLIRRSMTLPTGVDDYQPLGPWHDGSNLFLPPSLSFEATYRLAHTEDRNDIELLALKTWVCDEAGNLVEINYPDDFPGLNINEYVKKQASTPMLLGEEADWSPRDIETLAANLRQPLRADEPIVDAAQAHNSLLNNAKFTPIDLASGEISIPKIDIKLDMPMGDVHVGDTIRVAEWDKAAMEGVDIDRIVETKIERKLDGSTFVVSAKDGEEMKAFPNDSWEIRHLAGGDFAYAIYVGSQHIIDAKSTTPLSGLTDASKIYFVPSADYSAGTALAKDATITVTFADSDKNVGAIHYTANQSGSPLAINANAKHYLGNKNDTGVPVEAGADVTWAGKTLKIDLGNNPTTSDKPLIWSEKNAAFGLNATPEQEQAGVKPYRTEAGDEFITPNIEFAGTAELRGTKAIELVAMPDTFQGDYASVESKSRATGGEIESQFGKITVGGTNSSVTLNGGILQQLFAHKCAGDFSSNRNNTFGGIDLKEGSTVIGSVIVDGSIRADGTVKLESTNTIGVSNIAGKIESREQDSVGFCESVAGWFDASKIDTTGAGATLRIHDVTITGEIGNGTAASPNAVYTAVLLDGACHNTGDAQPSAADSLGERAKIQSSVGNVTLGHGARLVANTSGSGGLGTGLAVHTDAPTVIAIDGGAGTPNSISANDIGVLVDADSKGTTLKLANTSIGATSASGIGAAIMGRNTAIEIGDDVELHGSISAITSDLATTYGYKNGATYIESRGQPEMLALKTAQLDLTVKLTEGKKFQTEEPIVVSNYTQGADCKGKVISGSSLTVGQSLDVSSGSFRATSITWVGPMDTATADHMRLDATDMTELSVGEIDATEVAPAGPSEKCPSIELCGSDPATRYIGNESQTGAIIGNNIKAAADYAKYVQLQLTGAGGTINSAIDLGELRIETASDDGIWTIEGETSCSRLTIGKGKLHQLGKLTIWGDMLLLGCDIDWKDSVFNGGIYAPEDTIFARAGSRALIRNGFASNDESLINDLQYETKRLNGEGILLDGTAKFVVDANARAVNFQIVGVSDGKSAPVAIRVAKSRSASASGENRNVIELNRSLAIQYYDSEGKIYCGTPTAISGTRQTVLNLNQGTRAYPNFFRGSVRNVGQIEVNGNWRLLDGLKDCGHLRIARGGFLDVGQSMLDVRTLSIFIDPRREDSYLTCAGFLRDTVLEMRFDESILLNPNAQSYLLIDGLTDVAATKAKIHQLNIGGFSFDGEEGNLYLTFAPNDEVSANNPRRIYYLGGYVREDDECVDGESSEEKQYTEMRRSEAALAKSTDGSANEEDDADLFHGSSLRQVALREGEPQDTPPATPGANDSTPPAPPAPAAVASWSLQQADIVSQQLNQVRDLLLTHDFDPSQVSENYVAYLQPFGGFSKRKDISADLTEVKADRYGLLLGAQKYLQGGLFVQGAIGYGWTDDSFEQGDASRDCKTESILAAMEVAYRFETFNVRLVGTFGSDKYKYDRLIDGKVLHSEFDGYSIGGALQADYLVPFHGFLVGPVAEVSYDYIRHDAYKSDVLDGSAAADLEVNKFSARNGKVRLGLHFEQQTMGQMPYSVYGTATWVKTPYRRGLSSTMKVGAGAATQADDVFLSREAFEGRLGVRMQLASGWNVDGCYNIVNQKHFIDHAFSVQVGRQF